MNYSFVSWNVDGYSETIHQWLTDYLRISGPDLVFLGETKKPESTLQNYFSQFSDYNHVINAHVPPRYHGVAMLIQKRHRFVQYPVQMNIPLRKDSTSSEAAIGRVILIQLNGELNVIGSYTPNSGRSLENLAYRTQVWDPAFTSLLGLIRDSGPTVWMGDINVALSDLDVSDPVKMKSWAGFTLPERQNLYSLLSSGSLFDPWRIQHPNTREYSWVGRPHRSNYGMRIDNIIVSDTLLPRVVETYIIDDASEDTDHLPIVIRLN